MSSRPKGRRKKIHSQKVGCAYHLWRERFRTPWELRIEFAYAGLFCRGPYQSKAMNPPPFTSDELKRLESAVSDPPEFLSDQKKRQLRILLALCSGERVAAIAKAEQGLSEERVRNIRKKAAKSGLTSEIDRLTAKPEIAKTRTPGQQAHAGRPGQKTFDQRARAFGANDEAIFELSTLLLFPDVQVASFSIRLGRLDDFNKSVKKTGEENAEEMVQDRLSARLLKATKAVAKEVERASDEPVYWTKVSNLDDTLAELFKTLASGLDRMQPPAEEFRLPCVPLHRQFDIRFGHVILSCGAEEDVQAIVSLLGGETIFRHVRVNSESGFLAHLESVLYQRRMKASCIGFMPALWYLYEKANAWAQSAFEGPFGWQVYESDVHTCLQRHTVIKEYFAMCGALFEMGSVLWGKLLYQDDIDYASITYRTRVEVAEYLPEKKLVRLSIGPLPEYTYSVELPCGGSPEDLARVLRERVNGKTPAARKMIYSTRSHGLALRSSVELPPDFFAAAKDEEAATKAGDGFGVVLLPRHFLSHPPPVDLAQLVAWAGKQAPEIREETVLIDSGEERCCVFHTKLAYESIVSAFRQNRYGDAMRRLGLIQGRWLVRNSARKTQEEDLWLQPFMKFGPRGPTFYYFDEALFSSEECSPEDTIRLVHFKHHNSPPSEELVSEVEIGLQNVLRDNTPLPDELISKIEKGERRAIRSDSHELTYYNPWEQFSSLLRNMDADFLILGFDPETKAALEQLTAEWKKATQRILSEEYWPEEKLDWGKVAAVVRPTLRGELEKREGDVRAWTDQARISFVENCRFVIRGALENMQRLVLAGYQPHVIFVETRSELLSRWKAFLGKALNGRLSGGEDLSLIHI